MSGVVTAASAVERIRLAPRPDRPVCRTGVISTHVIARLSAMPLS